jgi:Putative Ig domain
MPDESAFPLPLVARPKHSMESGAVKYAAGIHRHLSLFKSIWKNRTSLQLRVPFHLSAVVIKQRFRRPVIRSIYHVMQTRNLYTSSTRGVMHRIGIYLFKRIVVVMLVVNLWQPFAHSQGPAPSATKNRLLSRLEGFRKPSSKPSNKEIAIPPLIVNLPIPSPANQTLVASATTAVNPAFTDCIAKSCRWSASTWPFVGMSLDANAGLLIGIPTNLGEAHIQVTAIDANGKSHQAPVFIKIVSGTLQVTTTSIPAYPTGQSIRETLTAEGGDSHYIWTTVGPPSLPSGVQLDANGVISGVATEPGSYKFNAAVKDTSGATSTAALELSITTAPDCANAKYTNARSPYFNGWFPLSRKHNTNPLGEGIIELPTENDVQCFYGTSGMVSVVGKVQYLYGFGGGANTISADLVSVQMPAPIGAQVSFGSSVTAGGTSTSSGTSTSNSTQPTVSAALQSVEAGGNFYIHALYPMAQYTSPHLSAYVYADPKVGFGVDGFAGQATLSQATEQYFSVPIESYTSYDGIGKTGGVYFDYRGGLESVPGGFAKAAGLSQHNFGLQQLTFGFNFVGLLRIGAQKYFGPAAAFNQPGTNESGFNKWHFVIQLSP